MSETLKIDFLALRPNQYYQPEHYHASGEHEKVQPDIVHATIPVPSSGQAPKLCVKSMQRRDHE